VRSRAEAAQKPFPQNVATLHNRLLSAYLTSPAQNVTSSQMVFHAMWALDQDRVLAMLVEGYQEDEGNLGRAVEIGLELKVSIAIRDKANGIDTG
jgi:hypothetical protein